MLDLGAISEAFQLVFTSQALLWLFIGVAAGIALGATPGISPSMSVALVFPLMFVLPIGASITLAIGAYKGAMYGGSISAISFGVPGTPAAAATVEDGYKLTGMGLGHKANEAALTASVTGDTLGSLFTIVVAPTVAMVALAFGPRERFWIAVLAILLIGVLSGRHLSKGLISAAIGIFLASIGTDPLTLQVRNTFGQWWLIDGIPLVPLMLGLFAVPVMLLELKKLITKGGAAEKAARSISRSTFKIGPGFSFREWWSCRKELGIGSITGIVLGMLPALGGTASAFTALGLAKQLSPHKQIGTGRVEGVVAAESANNATCGPTLIPLLVFGIPGSPSAAMIGACLMLKGITPSARMFEIQPEVILALFITLLIAQPVLFLIGRYLLRIFVLLAKTPKPVLIPAILLVSVAGVFGTSQNPYNVLLLVVIGSLGFGMALAGVPAVPAVISFIVAPIAEVNLRRILMITGGDWRLSLFGSPLALGLIALACALIFLMGRYLQGVTGKFSRET